MREEEEEEEVARKKRGACLCLFVLVCLYVLEEKKGKGVELWFGSG